MVDFDYVVVGTGAAGCVLASRLSEDPGNQVLLLEYGGRDTNPLLYVPEGYYFTLRGNRYTYHYPTRPIGPGGQVEAWMRGKVLGESTAINGMMWTRGAAADWDGLAASGNPAFGWERVLAAYRAMEDHNLGEGMALDDAAGYAAARRARAVADGGPPVPLTEQLQSMGQDIAAHAAKTASRRQRQHAVSRPARALTGEGETSP
jgi:choline dehydrogenase-like flavoprotein